MPSATELALSPQNRVPGLALVTSAQTGQPAVGLTSTLSPMMLKPVLFPLSAWQTRDYSTGLLDFQNLLSLTLLTTPRPSCPAVSTLYK